MCIMAAVRSSEECELESDYTLELPGSRTSSLTLITDEAHCIGAGQRHRWSSDACRSLLNGSQPKSFVHSGALVAPRTDDSLPPGALVNGSGSHRASEKPHIPAADASPSPRTDASPEVWEPPSELQSNTYRNPDEHLVLRAPSESDAGACETDLNDGPIGRVQTGCRVEAQPVWDSESSSDGYEGLNRNLREKFMCLLLNGENQDGATKPKLKLQGLRAASLSRRKRKTPPKNGKTVADLCSRQVACEDKELDRLAAHMMDDAEDAGGEAAPLRRRSDAGLESTLFLGTKHVADFEGGKQATGPLMLHQNEEQNASRPLICKECGRCFCERASLLKHMQIHQEQRERLMEEIKNLNERRKRAFTSDIPRHNPTNSGHDTPRDGDPEEHPRCTHLQTPRSSSACHICTFTSKSRDALHKHIQLVPTRANRESHDTRLGSEGHLHIMEDQQVEPISVWSNGLAGRHSGDNGAQTSWRSPVNLNLMGLSDVDEDNQQPEDYRNHVEVANLQDNADPHTKEPSAAVHMPNLKSSSKRKMSIPFHNTGVASFQHDSKVSTQEPCPSSSFAVFNPYQVQNIKVEHHFYSTDDESMEADEINTVVVKEEDIESALTQPDSDYVADCYGYRSYPAYEMEPKRCPYCPAAFDSGVGLSNHIRGHLHRLGLSYEARHMLSPEQVASQDRQPRLRRRAHGLNRYVRRGNPVSEPDHTCPLCLGWFDTKTGLSNHVRGHLKRIGTPTSGLSKSPLCILTELLQDQNQHENVLQILEPKSHLSRTYFSREFAASEGLFLASNRVPAQVQEPSVSEEQPLEGTDGNSRGEELHQRSWTSVIEEQLPEIREESSGEKESGGNSSTSDSVLVHLLKRRKTEQKPSPVGPAQARFMVPPCRNVHSSEQRVTLEPNKRTCVHCNATFHSGVSLSNHLRAYERRKRIALLEGTSFECSQKSPRSRSAPKIKHFETPPTTTTEVIYTLTCRFCDLVFEGPQCVQEDWVKHLQRHLLHTTVSGCSVPMAEMPTVSEGLNHVTQGL